MMVIWVDWISTSAFKQRYFERTPITLNNSKIIRQIEISKENVVTLYQGINRL